MELNNDAEEVVEDIDDVAEPVFDKALLTVYSTNSQNSSSHLTDTKCFNIQTNDTDLDGATKISAPALKPSDPKLYFDSMDENQGSSSKDAQVNLNFPFSKRHSPKSYQSAYNEKDRLGKMSFKRSPSVGKRTKNSDPLKRSEKMYLSDEDGVGSDVFNVQREEDERNYSSETELDVPWNQSDSIEADQYKMDPEADQMKEVAVVSLNSSASGGNELHSEGDSERGNVEMNDEGRIATTSSNLHCGLPFSSSPNTNFSVVKPSSFGQLSVSLPQIPVKQYSQPSGHDIQMFSNGGDVNLPHSIPSPYERRISLNPDSDQPLPPPSSSSSLSSSPATGSSAIGTIIGSLKVTTSNLVGQNFNEDQELNNTNPETNTRGELGTRAFQPEMGKFSLAEYLLRGSPDLQGSDDVLWKPHSKDIFGAAEVEQQLKRLLTLSGKHLPERSFFIEASFPAETKERQREEFGSSNAGSSDSYYQRESNLLKIKESLPTSFEYLMEPYMKGDLLQPRIGTLDSTNLLAENKILNASLDEQTFRRKHCEKQILLLQKRVVELQQSLAVAVSLDKMKDDTIKGVDRMLAKTVEGWRSKEKEMHSLFEKLTTENKSMKELLLKQQDVVLKHIGNEEELREKLVEERDRNELESKEHTLKVRHLQGRLDHVEVQKNDEINSLRKRLEDELRSKVKVEEEFHKKITDVQSCYENEQQSWRLKELEFREEMKALREKYSERINVEKMRSDKMQNINEEVKVSVRQAQMEGGRLKDVVDQLNHDKEYLETALVSKDEKQRNQLKELQDELTNKSRNEVAEVTRKLVELHKREIEDLMEMHVEEVGATRKDCDRRYGEVMTSLSQVIEETRRLKEENENLKSYKKNVASKVQLMVQAHCQEAQRLFDVDAANKRDEDSIFNLMNFATKSVLCDFGGSPRPPNKETYLPKYEKESGRVDPSPLATQQPIASMVLDLQQKSSAVRSKDPSHRQVGDKKQNRKGKIVRHLAGTLNNSEHNPMLPQCSSAANDFLIPSETFVTQNNKVKNSQPMKHLRHSRDPPTTDKNIQEADLLDRICDRNSNDLERSHTLRRYIKLMLQQSPELLSTELEDDDDDIERK